MPIEIKCCRAVFVDSDVEYRDLQSALKELYNQPCPKDVSLNLCLCKHDEEIVTNTADWNNTA